MAGLTDEQRAAVESIDHHVLVSAGAGSGKTHVLVERCLEILRRCPQATVANLVAVTYTTKAASEMRSRLKARLKELLASAGGEDGQRWAAAIAQVDGARIGTIHSLCESILKAFPVDANIDPRFEVLNELERSELMKESFDETARAAIAEQPEAHEMLMRYPVEDVRKWVYRCLESRFQFEEALESVPSLTEDGMTSHCRELIAREHERILLSLTGDRQWLSMVDELAWTPWKDPQSKLEAHRQTIVRLAAAALAPAGQKAGGRQGDLAERIGSLARILEVKVGVAGGNGDEARAVRDLIALVKEPLKRCLKDVPLDLCAADREAFHLTLVLVRFAQRVRELFSRKKRERTKLDFDDLIESAYAVLSREDSAARQFYNDNVAAILVDEFQDTNRLQSRLFSLLSGEKTRLFLIGDDKQSIYKFQGADVSVFNAWRENFGREKGGILSTLSISFRSHRQIVSFVNAVFERLLGKDQRLSAHDARFQPLAAHRQDGSPAAPLIDVVVYQALDEAGQRQAELAEVVEARAAANWIAGRLLSGQMVLDKASGSQRPIRWGDFAVLVQDSNRFRAIEAALSDLGIPYVTQATKGFLRRQEVYDVENLLKFLCCRRDSQALLGALRSPMFGIADDVIHSLHARYGSSLWAAATRSLADEPGWCPELERAVAILSGLIEAAATLPAGDLVRRIVDDTRYDVILLAAPGGRQRSRNLWKLTSLACDHNNLSPSEFVSRLGRMRALEVKEVNAPLDAGDAVKLMTIHAAKGLEFPAVVLPGMSRPATARSDKLLFHRQYGLIFDPSRDKAAPKPALYLIGRRIEKEMDEAERKRLLYVAATRARDCLAIFLERGGQERASFRSWLKGALGLDDGGCLTEPGVYELEAAPEPVFYQVTTVDSISASTLARELKAALRSAAAAAGRDDGGREAQFDLVEPLTMEPGEPALNWQDALRVTAAAGVPWPEPTVLGQFFHLIMQTMSPAMQPPAAGLLRELAASSAANLVDREKISRLVEAGQVLLERFRKSDLCALMQAARRRLGEMPYVVASASASRQGRPDLLLEDAGGHWFVIDYKTDHFPIEELASHVEKHRQQLRSYVDDFQQLAGVRPRAALYFAQHGRLEEVAL